jgi:hypothetical protein
LKSTRNKIAGTVKTLNKSFSIYNLAFGNCEIVFDNEVVNICNNFGDDFTDIGIDKVSIIPAKDSAKLIIA